MPDFFSEQLPHLLKAEGGFVNHPRDPGGATNLGVTKNVYEAYIGRKVTIDTIKSLKVSDVESLYRTLYWDRLKCDRLPKALAVVIFDFGVNAGTSRAIKTLQKVLGIAEDGIIGEITIKKVLNMKDVKKLVDAYSDRRILFYKQLKTFPTFGKGWLSRVEVTRNLAYRFL